MVLSLRGEGVGGGGGGCFSNDFDFISPTGEVIFGVRRLCPAVGFFNADSIAVPSASSG
ncbi:MAG: hypothetical protein PVF83_13195 [Anaerolineales bacterium]